MQTVRFPVYLFRDEAVLAIGEACKMGPGGMLVRPTPGFTARLPTDCPLEVGFGVEQGAITRRYRIRVHVVQQNTEGFGLAFDAEDAAFVTAVTRALIEPPPAS